MTEDRQKLIDRFQQWFDTNPNERLIAYQCATIAEQYAKEQISKLNKHDVISCVCPNEIKTGTVAIHCCNLCGKPDEDWWGKH